MPPIVYADLRGSSRLNEHLQLFANVDNLLNKALPNVVETESRSAYSFAAISGIHDAIGRSYRIGARLKF